MTYATDNLALRDLVLLRQQTEIEQHFITASLHPLRAEVRERFGVRAGPRPLRAGVTRPFAVQYSTGMAVSYLFGALHVQKLMDSQAGPIRLAGERFNVPFAEAEDFLRAQVAMPRDDFDALNAGLKFRAFTIAKVGQEDLIRRIQGLYQAQLANGTSRADLLQNLDGLLTQAGIGIDRPYWLETHYRNNMMAAYNAGRWAQLEGNPQVAYLMYNSIIDDDTTKLCRELHGTVLVKGDKRWKSIHPTNHHSCRAVVTPISAAQAKLQGITPSELDLKSLKKDPQVAREHQFKGHPAEVLDVVPSAMAERANNYGQWPDIIKFAGKANKAWLSQRVTALGKGKLGKSTILHVAEKRPVKDSGLRAARAALATPDEVWLTLTKDSGLGVRQSMLLLNWSDDGKEAMAVAARVTGGAKTFYTMSKPVFEQRVKQNGWVKIQ